MTASFTLPDVVTVHLQLLLVRKPDQWTLRLKRVHGDAAMFEALEEKAWADVIGPFQQQREYAE